MIMCSVYPNGAAMLIVLREPFGFDTTFYKFLLTAFFTRANQDDRFGGVHQMNFTQAMAFHEFVEVVERRVRLGGVLIVLVHLKKFFGIHGFTLDASKASSIHWLAFGIDAQLYDSECRSGSFKIIETPTFGKALGFQAVQESTKFIDMHIDLNVMRGYFSTTAEYASCSGFVTTSRGGTHRPVIIRFIPLNDISL